MPLELEGKLVQIFEARSGTSSNGTNWTSQDFLIEVPGQYVSHAVFNVYGGRVNLAQFALGDTIRVSFDVRAREYQGRWYTTLNAWKVDKAGVGMPTNQQYPTAAAGSYQAQGVNAQQPVNQTTMHEDPNDKPGDNKDDLPF